MILPQERDPRLVTIRRGGTLTDVDHRLLALWAAACAEHVLALFEVVQPSDPRPRQAIEAIRAWTRGEIRMSESRAAGGHAMAAARALTAAPRYAAYAAGQAAVVAHVSRTAREAGSPEVVLFTDVANPTSNSVYQRIGFRAVEDRVVLELLPQPSLIS